MKPLKSFLKTISVKIIVTPIFQQKIYVFGGYTGDKKRSKKIEVYDPFKNYWETLNVQLNDNLGQTPQRY